MKFKEGDLVTPIETIYSIHKTGAKLKVLQIRVNYSGMTIIMCKKPYGSSDRPYLEKDLEFYDVYHSPLNEALR